MAPGDLIPDAAVRTFLVSDELGARVGPRLPGPTNTHKFGGARSARGTARRRVGFGELGRAVERTHRWMNRFRGILIRWSKKADNHLALIHPVCAIITLRCAGLFG